jgi:ribonuclease P protein component
MLPVKNRLPAAVLGQKFAAIASSKEFVLLFNKTDRNSLRAAVIINKRVAPKAVDRNRIRRVVTESLKDKLNLGGDLKILVKYNIANLKKDAVESKLADLLAKLT